MVVPVCFDAAKRENGACGRGRSDPSLSRPAAQSAKYQAFTGVDPDDDDRHDGEHGVAPAAPRSPEEKARACSLFGSLREDKRTFANAVGEGSALYGLRGEFGPAAPMRTGREEGPQKARLRSAGRPASFDRSLFCVTTDA